MTSVAPVLGLDDAVQRAHALAGRFAATAAETDRTAEFPFANFDALYEAGLLNLTTPCQLGGAGGGLEAACRVVSVIAGGEASTALVLAMHHIYMALGSRAPWRPDVFELIARQSIEGVSLINVMRAEPELGTPARGGLPATTAEPFEGGWRVSGHKLYATGSPLLEWFITWGRTAGDDPQVGWFAIPRGTGGLRIVETWDHLGMRATGSHDLVLEDAIIPWEYAIDLRPPKAWLGGDQSNGVWNTLVLAALYHGIAVAAMDWLKGYLHERVPANLGAPLASLPRFQAIVGEMSSLLFANERLVFGLAREMDQTEPYPASATLATSQAKYLATNNAVKAVDLAMGLVGNPGLFRSNPLERHHRDVLCSRIHVPQDDMVLQMAGKLALALQ